MGTVKNIDLKLRRLPAWIFAAALLLGGIALGIYTILNFNRATIQVAWSTASEIDTVGYHLLRSEHENGPFIQINPQLIAASEDPLLGGEYTYEDQGLQAGQTYYYILEEIEASGLNNQHGPILQKAANHAWLNLGLAMLFILCGGIFLWLGRDSQPKPVLETE